MAGGLRPSPGLRGTQSKLGRRRTIGKEHTKPERRLAAHGTAVGLSDGLMGNSEVGNRKIRTHYLFLNGGVEKQFALEERLMIPSPKPQARDERPGRRGQGCQRRREQRFPPARTPLGVDTAPQIGHTGNFDAAVSAITHTDAAVGTVYDACQAAGYVLLVTADHGNAEQMRNADTGAPHTAHTCNPVPFILAGPASEGYALVPDDERAEDEEEGALCDVAPTVLDLLSSRRPERKCTRAVYQDVLVIYGLNETLMRRMSCYYRATVERPICRCRNRCGKIAPQLPHHRLIQGGASWSN
ncbi:alkaline-phosphatase-like protein [Mycena latifolia]|nr:alkaline-phosphatase-like protein [Mycena latifolia]